MTPTNNSTLQVIHPLLPARHCWGKRVPIADSCDAPGHGAIRVVCHVTPRRAYISSGRGIQTGLYGFGASRNSWKVGFQDYQYNLVPWHSDPQQRLTVLLNGPRMWSFVSRPRIFVTHRSSSACVVEAELLRPIEPRHSPSKPLHSDGPLARCGWRIPELRGNAMLQRAATI